MAAPVTTTYTPWIDESTAASTTSARRCCATPIPPTIRSPATSKQRARCTRLPRGRRDRRALQSELIRALADGPGVVVFEDAFSPESSTAPARPSSRSSTPNATRARPRAITSVSPGQRPDLERRAEARATRTGGVRRVLRQRHLAIVCQAWLGPRYQVTSQVNVVNPGGAQQVPHRDYHLGFVARRAPGAYPAHLHSTSPVLTLQGAVAHCDMPVESGPTMLLPCSQRFVGGYIAFYRPEFVDFFAEHHVQLPLNKGDAVFFNPALYHGAGSNVSGDIRRIANLLQVSSPFGRAMEALDRTAMVRAIYPSLLAMKAAGCPPARPLQRSRRDRGGLRISHQPRQRSTHRQPRPPSQVDSDWRHSPKTSARTNSTSFCAPNKNRERHDHPRRNRIGPDRRLPHRYLSGLDSIDGLVVTDERPEVVAAVAAKHGAKPVDSVEALLASGVDGIVVGPQLLRMRI